MPGITDPAVATEERIDAYTLRVTRRSTFTRQVHTRDLVITAEEWERYQRGTALIQDALPSLTNPEREFLLTGTTQAEWEAAFAASDEEEA